MIASAFLFSSYKLTFWDVGGQRSLRSFWRNYFENTDALIWVVDSADRLRMEDCKKELHSLLLEEVNSSRIRFAFFFCQLVVFCLFTHSNNSFSSFQRLAGATLVIFANKQDLPSAATSAQIAEVGIFFTSSRRLTIHINILRYVYQVRNIKWSGILSGPAIFQKALCVKIRSLSLWHTHETASHAHMPQVFTLFPFRLFSAGGQKCDFCKWHFRREYKVVHSLWHTHETQGPSTSIARSYATTLYAFPI